MNHQLNQVGVQLSATERALGLGGQFPRADKPKPVPFDEAREVLVRVQSLTATALKDLRTVQDARVRLSAVNHPGVKGAIKLLIKVERSIALDTWNSTDEAFSDFNKDIS